MRGRGEWDYFDGYDSLRHPILIRPRSTLSHSQQGSLHPSLSSADLKPGLRCSCFLSILRLVCGGRGGRCASSGCKYAKIVLKGFAANRAELVVGFWYEEYIFKGFYFFRVVIFGTMNLFAFDSFLFYFSFWIILGVVFLTQRDSTF